MSSKQLDEAGLPNSEILILYEAKNCNPNGDPDSENRPRIDPRTGINFVSDVRLKRFFRDYIVEKFGEESIYVTKIDGENIRADNRLKKAEIEKGNLQDVLKKFIDARLFGATIPLGKEGEESRGTSKSFTGPVQFTWGFSFHKVELIDFPTITSVFSGREQAEGSGTIGKDWRLYYSLLGFYGVVSGRRAIKTCMSTMDLKIFDDYIWTALQVQPTTRSKIGEKPHLYLRVEYNNPDTLFGDLRKHVNVESTEPIRDFSNLKINFNPLIAHLKKHADKISKIYLRTSDELQGLVDDITKNLTDNKVVKLPYNISITEIKKSLVQQ
ncbi:MAG: type I-B CRISPR-associated protein Cas7/Csh2 [Candidatus Odinarchaeota archaeon]